MQIKIVTDENFKKLQAMRTPKLDPVEVGHGRTSFNCLYHDGKVFIRQNHAEALLAYVIDIDLPETYN